MLSLFSVFFIQCQGMTREGDRGVLQSAEQGKPRAARQPPGAHLPGLLQAAGPDSRMEVLRLQRGNQCPTKQAPGHLSCQRQQTPCGQWPSFSPLPGFISGIPNKEKRARPSDPLQSHPRRLGSNITGGACCDTSAQRSWRHSGFWPGGPCQINCPVPPEPTSTEKTRKKVLARPPQTCLKGWPLLPQASTLP